MIKPRPVDLVHKKWLQQLQVVDWQQKRVLDLGCGSGYLCEAAIEQGASFACGIDILTPPDLPAKPKWTFTTQNLDDPTWNQRVPAPFDLILAFDVIEHLESPYLFLQACRDVLSPQGQLIVTTPNLDSWERKLKPDTWSGATDPQHKLMFTRYSLQFLLNRIGMRVVELQAPMNSLSFLGPLQPQIGGQILCKAQLH